MCVTLKGDRYNPQGTLEGGFNKQAGFLKEVVRYKDALEKRTNLQVSKDKLDVHYRELTHICTFHIFNHS